MKERLQQLQQDALSALQQAASLSVLQDVRVKILGKKGLLTEVMKGMRDLSTEQRPVIGALINNLKDRFEETFVAVKLNCSNRISLPDWLVKRLMSRSLVEKR